MNNNKDINTSDEVVRAIHNAKLQLEHMVDLVPQVMLLINTKGVIERANLAFLKLVGTSDFNSVLQKNIAGFFTFEDDDFLSTILSVENYGAHEMGTTIVGGVSGHFRYTV
ncbi:MAG: PAS domain-containing protein, partial [Kiritimatiellae bacterium]|nr:PAS domain-containing protein [Kiritimatiellia bacterium]